MKYLKIFDNFHNILDEIYEYAGLKYTWTLNGLGRCEFDIALESEKCTPVNFKFRNHLEVWESETNTCIWGGQIIDRGFQGIKLHISCFGYLSLLKWRRLRAKSYSEMSYGNLVSTMVSDTNSEYITGVTIGDIQAGSLRTQRIVEDKDFLLDKIQNYIQDCNNDIEVDNDRKFNFYLRKGSVKPYVLQYGSDADNILIDPSLTQSVMDMANSVYAESKNGETTLSSLRYDLGSIGQYGLMEGVYAANSDIVIQSTLDNYANGDLQRRFYPTNSISLKIKNSTLCPFDNIEVGDTVTVNLIRYWNFSENLRILEITHNEDEGTRDIVVGQTLYRLPAPIKKIYIK